jgi:hypothetical protein
MADTQADRLAKAIDEATEAAQASVNAYSKLAKEAAAQFAGDAPADTGTWMQFAAKSYAQAAADTAKAWTAYYEMLKALADEKEK